eukprot:5577238-Pyramimonas_sp.AAC.2
MSHPFRRHALICRSDPESNYGGAFEQLFKHVPIHSSQVSIPPSRSEASFVAHASCLLRLLAILQGCTRSNTPNSRVSQYEGDVHTNVKGMHVPSDCDQIYPIDESLYSTNEGASGPAAAAYDKTLKGTYCLGDQQPQA